MGIKTLIKENWLTKKPSSNGLVLTLALMIILILGSYMYLSGLGNADEWMPASAHAVYSKKEWWRAWTTLFAHGDLSHILGNLFLFFPFSYFLISYFGFYFFPFFGFFVGGLVNLIVLKTMPEFTSLIGVSGVVNWMGGAWIALYWLIDKRDSNGRRCLRAIAYTIVLFAPSTYEPGISYITHFIGYFLGIISGMIFYFLFKKSFLKEEVTSLVFNNINFKELSLKDRELVYKWFSADHVKAFWRMPLGEVEFESAFSDMLCAENEFYYIAYLDENPVGFVKLYDREGIGRNWQESLRPGLFEIKILVGDKELLNKGIARNIIKEFANEFFERNLNHRLISFISSKNANGLSAFMAAGFKRRDVIEEEGEVFFRLEKYT